MVIKIYSAGPIKEHPYLVIDEVSKKALCIDPGGEIEKIIDDLAAENAELVYIVNTHVHPDHISHNAILKDMTGAKLIVHADDASFFKLNWDGYEKKYDCKILAGKPDDFVKDGDRLLLNSLAFLVIHTPGHTPGGISLYCAEDGVLFSGDTLFYHAIGRTDLPKSSDEDILKSLGKLFKLPPSTKVYPGHGPQTTIEEEMEFLGKKAFF